MIALALPDTLLGGVQRGLFVLTVVLTVAALVGALRCRAGFAPDDLGRRTWTFFAAFLGIRILAELRLTTLYFDVVPAMSETARTVYVVGLRYLYTLSDVLLVVGLLLTIRAWRGLGLHFRLQRVDALGMVLVALLPVAAFLLREQLTGFVSAQGDRSIVAYRLVAATVTAVIAALCIAVLRFARQMGGGALSRIWGAVVVAGLARAASFVALAAVTTLSPAAGDVAEQALLLVFALAWIRATGLQRRVLAPS